MLVGGTLVGQKQDFTSPQAGRKAGALCHACQRTRESGKNHSASGTDVTGRYYMAQASEVSASPKGGSK